MNKTFCVKHSLLLAVRSYKETDRWYYFRFMRHQKWKAKLLCGIWSIQYALFYMKVWKLFTTRCGKCGCGFVI